MKTNNPAGDDALLPCPFCGGEGEHYQPNEDIAVIACTKCNAESGYYDGEDSTTPYDAVKFWNTRPSPAGVDNHEEGVGDDEVRILLKQIKNAIDGYGQDDDVVVRMLVKDWYVLIRAAQPKPSAPGDATALLREMLKHVEDTGLLIADDRVECTLAKVRRFLDVGLSAPAEGRE